MMPVIIITDFRHFIYSKNLHDVLVFFHFHVIYGIPSHGSFTLHGTGNGTGNGTRTGTDGYNALNFTHYTGTWTGNVNRGQMGCIPISLFPVPVPFPFPTPCSVNEPLGTDAQIIHAWYLTCFTD